MVNRSFTRARLIPALLVALIALGAAWLGLLPGVTYWDTGEFQTVGPLMGTAHPTGFPTYVLLGWLASVVLQPLGEPAFRMNLLSAICLAVAAGVTVDLVRALTRSIALGVAAGLAMALTPAAWTIATHADPHTLHLAFVAILLRLLVAWEARVRPGPDVDRPAPLDRGDRFLVATAVVFGLAAGNHSLTVLLSIPVGLFVVAVDPSILSRGRLVIACLAALFVTLAVVFLELPLRAGPFRAPLVYGAPDTWDGFAYIVLAEQFRTSVVDPLTALPGKFGDLVDRTALQFGILAPLIPFAFLATALRRPRYALLTGTAVAITCFFSASYVNAQIGRYYLGPILMTWSWLAILASLAVDAVAGAAEPIRGGDPTRSRFPRLTPSRMIAVLLAGAILAPTALAAPARFGAVDESDDRDAARWVSRTLTAVQPDAVLVTWWSYSTPLWYAQHVEGLRSDVTIVDDRTRLDENLGDVTDVIDANLGRRPVYVLRAGRQEAAMLAQRYQLEYLDGGDATALTRVVALRSAAS